MINPINIRNTAYFFIASIALVLILVLGQRLILPFVFAVVFWFAVRQIRLLMDKVNFLKTKVPLFIKNTLAIVVIFFIAFHVVNTIASSLNKLAGSMKKYEANINTLTAKIYETFNIDVWEHINQYIGTFNLADVFLSVVDISTGIASTALMVFIYSVFVFWEEATFKKKFKKLFSDEQSYSRASLVIRNVEEAAAKYLGVKTFVSLLTGTLSFFVLIFFEVDSPFLWAFILFLFNYIPVIGSFFATLFPVVFSLLQFGSFVPGVFILGCITGIQIMVGNILDPKLMGKSINLSPIVTIISLSIWGAIWGVPGMFLSVPILAVVVIILNQFENTRPVAIMLSGKG